MLLLDNFAHSDLHAGNIMVRFVKSRKDRFLQRALRRLKSFVAPQNVKRNRDPTSLIESTQITSRLVSLAQRGDQERWQEAITQYRAEGYKPELIMIDAGLITTLNDQNRRNFLDLFEAIATFDGHLAGKLMIERCRSPELVIDADGFSSRIQHLVDSVKNKTFTLSQIKISDVLTEVLNAVRQHHVRIESDFVNTVISVRALQSSNAATWLSWLQILLLEGIGRRLDPDLDLFKAAVPVLRQVGAQAGREGFKRGDTSVQGLLPFLKVRVTFETLQCEEH